MHPPSGLGGSLGASFRSTSTTGEKSVKEENKKTYKKKKKKHAADAKHKNYKIDYEKHKKVLCLFNVLALDKLFFCINAGCV